MISSFDTFYPGDGVILLIFNLLIQITVAILLTMFVVGQFLRHAPAAGHAAWLAWLTGSDPATQARLLGAHLPVVHRVVRIHLPVEERGIELLELLAVFADDLEVHDLLAHCGSPPEVCR